MTNEMLTSLAYGVVSIILWGIICAPKEWFSWTGKMTPATILWFISTIIIGKCFQHEEIIFILIWFGSIGLLIHVAFDIPEMSILIFAMITTITCVLFTLVAWSQMTG